MAMKKLLKLLLCLPILGVLVQCGGGANSPQNFKKQWACMDRIMTLDDSLGTIRNHDSESMSLSASIKKYTHALEKLPFEDCPQEFVEAFGQHQAAWLQLLPITDKYPELRGELHDIFKMIEEKGDKDALDKELKEVITTWTTIEETIKKH